MSYSVGLFADDYVIYSEVTNDLDVRLLQSDLDNASRCCEQWQMELNISKC